MKNYQIVFSKSAAKDLRKLPDAMLQKVYAKIKLLEEDPYPSGCKKLAGQKEDLWRIRTGDYRIIYAVDEPLTVIDIRKIGHRKDIYK